MIIIADIAEAYRKPFVEIKPFSVSKLSPSDVQTFQHIKENAEFYTIILNSDVFSTFQSRLHRALKEINKTFYKSIHQR